MKKYILISIATLILIAGCAAQEISNPTQEDTSATDSQLQEVSDSEAQVSLQPTIEVVPIEPYAPPNTYVAELSDVSGGTATGQAMAALENEVYNLAARFEGLPDPQGTDFYEGWVVRKGAELSVISTGRAEKSVGDYVNIFTSDQDLSDHTSYILTLEPDDGDPAPAEHILAGEFEAPAS